MSIDSAKSLIASSQNQPLVRGGPSSSDTLNKIFDRGRKDLLDLNNQVQTQNRTQQLLSVYLAGQATGIQAMVSKLATLVPAAPAGRGVADMFGTDFIDGSNTATIDQFYGQATLPILSVDQKLYETDSQGKVWVPSDSRIRFLATPAYTPGVIPGDDLFLSSTEDYLGIGNQPNNFFIGGNLPTSGYLFVKFLLPQALNSNNLSNRITFNPVPAFSHNLVGAFYKKTDGTWNAIDFSYLTNYSGGVASLVGPTRLHFPASEVVQVCLVLRTIGWWGVQESGVELVQYSSNANLVVDLASYSPTTITSVVVGGKDPSVLSGYNQTITGSKVSIALTPTTSFQSPIITSVGIYF